MTGVLIFIIIVELIVIGYQFHKLQEMKKELSYFRENDQLKDDLQK